MNILVIGNGFDLQHKLPTNYTDFLNFCEGFIKAKNKEAKEPYEYKNYKEFEREEPDLFKEFISLLDCFWITYFIEKKTTIGDKWVNFETQIENKVKKLANERELASRNELPTSYTRAYCYRRYNNGNCKSYAELFSYLADELKRMIRALEIYLVYYVPKNMNPDYKMSLLENIKPDKVLSFNYTSTYLEKYPWDVEYDYIHGSAQKTVDSAGSKLVLGYDDHYLVENPILELVPFEKYFQRIVNQTGAKYKDWLNEFDGNGNLINRTVYFYGHSFSPADGDVIRSLILSPNTHTVIYYRKGYFKDKADMIKNLAVVLGPEELIRRTGKGGTITIQEYEDSYT